MICLLWILHVLALRIILIHLLYCCLTLQFLVCSFFRVSSLIRTACHSAGTEPWKKMSDPPLPKFEVLTKLATHLYQLGLRFPSESTIGERHVETHGAMLLESEDGIQELFA